MSETATPTPESPIWRTPGGRSLRLADAGPAMQAWLAPLLASAGWRPLPHTDAHSEKNRPAAANDATHARQDDLSTDPARPPTTDTPRAAPPAADDARSPANPDSGAASSPADDAVPPPAVDRPATGPALLTATEAGGLLFLLPVLARLGFDAWSESLPTEQSAHLVARCLLGALGRLDLADDPFADALTGLLIDPFELDFAPPAIWSDPHIGVTAGGPLDDVAVAALWLTAARRYLRRVARIGLASTVRRSAGFNWSPTHVDVHFDLKDCDLRVRRAGLDLDPGWLPWLGRVVGFHYSDK